MRSTGNIAVRLYADPPGSRVIVQAGFYLVIYFVGAGLCELLISL